MHANSSSISSSFDYHHTAHTQNFYIFFQLNFLGKYCWKLFFPSIGEIWLWQGWKTSPNPMLLLQFLWEHFIIWKSNQIISPRSVNDWASFIKLSILNMFLLFCQRKMVSWVDLMLKNLSLSSLLGTMCGLLPSQPPPLPVPLLPPPLLAQLNRLSRDKAWLEANLPSRGTQIALYSPCHRLSVVLSHFLSLILLL